MTPSGRVFFAIGFLLTAFVIICAVFQLSLLQSIGLFVAVVLYMTAISFLKEARRATTQLPEDFFQKLGETWEQEKHKEDSGQDDPYYDPRNTDDDLDDDQK